MCSHNPTPNYITDEYRCMCGRVVITSAEILMARSSQYDFRRLWTERVREVEAADAAAIAARRAAADGHLGAVGGE